jgi:hypothetical protein
MLAISFTFLEAMHCVCDHFAQLRHYRLHKEPQIIQLEGLNDPNSPLGKMFLSQDPQLRSASYRELEQMVINLASARGKIEVQDFQPRDPDEDDIAA